jgi:hypothetical protein
MSLLISANRPFILTQSRRLHDILVGRFEVEVLPLPATTPYRCILSSDNVQEALHVALAGATDLPAGWEKKCDSFVNRHLKKKQDGVYWNPATILATVEDSGLGRCHFGYIFLISVGNRAQANMDFYPPSPSLRQGFSTTVVGLLLYALVHVIYNVFFHPLSRFPRPPGAVCTKWWLAYMELGRRISLSTVRVELHQKYGTVSPWVLL